MPSVQQRGRPGTPVPRSGNATNSKYDGRFPDTYFKRGQSKGKPRWVATSECYGLDAAECKTSPKCTVGRRGCKRTRSDKGGRHKKRAVSGSRTRATQSQATGHRDQARTRQSASRSRSPQRSPPRRRSSRLLLAGQTSRSQTSRSPPRRSPPRRMPTRRNNSPRRSSRLGLARRASRSPPRRTSPRARASKSDKTALTKLSKKKKKK